MSRKHTPRRVLVAMPPRGMRPKLTSQQVRDLALCHLVNLDAIATETACPDTLWQTIGGHLTWWRVAQVLQLGFDEMTTQLAIVTRVAERYQASGRIHFMPDEYELAKDGLQVMDQLAEAVDRATAVEAANWSEARVEQMASKMEMAA